MEGWRAVLTVVMRTGLGRRQRQRTRTSLGSQSQQQLAANTTDDQTQQSEAVDQQESRDMDVDDGIQAMVTDVKARGVSIVLLSLL